MKTTPTAILFTVEKTDTGYSAFAQNYDVYTTGKNLADLTKNMKEAFDLYLEAEEIEMNYELKPEFSIPLLFDYYKVINASALSERIGMNQSLLAQYIKGHKKPSAKQVERIMTGVKEIGNELAQLQLA